MWGVGLAEMLIIAVITLPGLVLFVLVVMALVKYIRGGNTSGGD